MRSIPLLITDFIRAIEKLPNLETWEGPDEVSVTVMDGITKMNRHILFQKKKALVNPEDTEETPFWVCWQTIAIDQKYWKLSKKGK